MTKKRTSTEKKTSAQREIDKGYQAWLKKQPNIPTSWRDANQKKLRDRLTEISANESEL